MSDPRPPELAAHPFLIPWPVAWGDQDAFGHVNNVVYYRWMESARIAYFREGLGIPGGINDGVGPILASLKCDFRRQLSYPDNLLISASVTSIGRTSIRLAHLVYSNALQAIAAEGDSTIVMFNYDTQRPTPVPEDMRAKIEALEQRTIPTSN